MLSDAKAELILMCSDGEITQQPLFRKEAPAEQAATASGIGRPQHSALQH